MQPRLSICIATLNRVNFIGATLDSIFAQAQDSPEVVVVDGASTDGTSELLSSTPSEPRLRFERLSIKGGGTKTIVERWSWSRRILLALFR